MTFIAQELSKFLITRFRLQNVLILITPGHGRSRVLRGPQVKKPWRCFFHWNISVICLIAVIKLAVTVFICLYFQTFWSKWLNFFSVISKTFRSVTEKSNPKVHHSVCLSHV